MENFATAAACWKILLSDASRQRELLPLVERFARENTAPAPVVFGTSGWRGEIGTDFTFSNIRIVTAAILELFRTADSAVLRSLGVSGLDEIRKRGVIVGHDNRFLGPQFAGEVMGLLQQAGIRTFYAGEAATPEFSAGVERLGAACSVNLTPSHNPANYAGFKFNPSDGGPAGTEITSRIEAIANRMMQDGAAVPHVAPRDVERVDLTALYVEYLKERGTIDLGRIKRFLAGEDCCICVDNVHGATRSRLERILGRQEKIRYLRTGDDYLFGGVAPEPSEKNMAGIAEVLAASTAKFKLGAIMDPDGDRIRHCDGSAQVPMNYFGAMALHFLHTHKGCRGVVAKSVGTSNFVNAIAKKLGVAVMETKVGFKNFRPYLLPSANPKAVVAFEESDGITGYNHTLEKDALFGLLLAIEMVAVTGENLGLYLEELMNAYGHYYPDRSGIAVDRSLVGDPLKKKLGAIVARYGKGEKVSIGDSQKTVEEVITVDGLKLVFDDGSWLMIRPSGTEPKVRFYIEARTMEGKQAVFEAAERMTKEALR